MRVYLVITRIGIIGLVVAQCTVAAPQYQDVIDA